MHTDLFAITLTPSPDARVSSSLMYLHGCVPYSQKKLRTSDSDSSCSSPQTAYIHVHIRIYIFYYAYLNVISTRCKHGQFALLWKCYTEPMIKKHLIHGQRIVTKKCWDQVSPAVFTHMCRQVFVYNYTYV